MAVTTTQTNKPFNPRGNDQSPKGYNRAALYSGKALDFDGVNDYVDLDGFTLSGTTATFVFNLKMDDWIDNKFIFDADNQRLVIGTGDIGNEIGLYDSTAWKMFGTISDTTNTNNFAIVIDGTTAKCFLNGQSFGTDQTITNIDLSNPSNVALGSRNDGLAYFLNGQMAGFKVFNTALTAAQVADLYNNPEKVVPTGVDNTALKLWLPMQEGAGTTAYDGSGNNLGSEEVTNGDFATDSDWTKEAGWTISGGKATFDGSATTNALFQNIGGVSGTKYLLSFEVTDYVSGSVKAYLSNGDVSASTPSINANGKYVFDITATGVLVLFRNETSFVGSIDNVSVKEITNYGTISGATWTHGIGAPVAQTSVIDWNKHTLDGTNEVLVPQGLTSGRDLLGNLFENVRKQGALNLDGNSWAEVHDNASLDITSEITLEAWVYWNGSTAKGLLGRWKGAGSLKSYLLFANTTTAAQFLISNNGSANYAISTSTSISIGWNHIVGTADGSKVKIYLNGAFENEAAAAVSIYTTNLPVEIGRLSDGGNVFDDQIAQPRIYNRALTAEEVQRNYNAGKNTYTN